MEKNEQEDKQRNETESNSSAPAPLVPGPLAVISSSVYRLLQSARSGISSLLGRVPSSDSSQASSSAEANQKIHDSKAIPNSNVSFHSTVATEAVTLEFEAQQQDKKRTLEATISKLIDNNPADFQSCEYFSLYLNNIFNKYDGELLDEYKDKLGYINRIENDELSAINEILIKNSPTIKLDQVKAIFMQRQFLRDESWAKAAACQLADPAVTKQKFNALYRQDRLMFKLSAPTGASLDKLYECYISTAKNVANLQALNTPSVDSAKEGPDNPFSL